MCLQHKALQLYCKGQLQLCYHKGDDNLQVTVNMSSEQCNNFIYNRCHYSVYKLVLCKRQTPAPTTLLLYSKLQETLSSSRMYKITSLVLNNKTKLHFL